VPDVEKEERYPAAWRGLMLASGLRACRSTPVRAAGGRVLGCLALYFGEPRDPNPADLDLVETATHLAAIAIEHDRAAAALLDANRASLDFAGSAREEMVGRPFAETAWFAGAPGAPEKLRASIARAAAGEFVRWEAPLARPSGEIVTFDFSLHPVRDEDGNVVLIVPEGRDISLQAQARQALAALNATLERRVAERSRALEAEMVQRQKIEAALHQAQRLDAIGQLTGGVAHDFNNLLTVVVGQAEAIIGAAEGNDRVVRMATAARRAAERGAQLTSQLLTFARRQQLQPEPLAVHDALLEIGDLLRRVIGETVSVEIRADAGVWLSLLDRAQFESAILNLAVNARDAMPDGGRLTVEAGNVTISGFRAQRLGLVLGDYVLVAMTDTGYGMAPEVRSKAFEPFFTTKDVGKGTGLGLAQIYGFAKQSGGTATIDSAPGKGTTVSLYLPRAGPRRVEGFAPSGDEVPASGRGKTILVVEDQPEVRDVIEMYLDSLDYRVLTAADGAAARELLKSEERIDLLLTDMMMPNGVDGLDLARQARRLRQGLKIVVISGYRRDIDDCDGRPSGLTFLKKPFRQAELTDAIAAALGRR
jgi:PAS domain S-box-containing protein